MQKPSKQEKLLSDIDRMLAEAPDEASRKDLERLRDSLNSQQMRAMAEAANATPRRKPEDLVLHFHAPLYPVMLTASGCVMATAICLYAAMLAFENPLILISGKVMNLWLIAAFFGSLSVLFMAMSLKRSYFVRIDTQGMAARSAGKRWRHLSAGDLIWKDIRSLHERGKDRVLEIRTADGEKLEVPMKLVNYNVLKHHLDNMVLLYGDRVKGE